MYSCWFVVGGAPDVGGGLAILETQWAPEGTPEETKAQRNGLGKEGGEVGKTAGNEKKRTSLRGGGE